MNTPLKIASLTVLLGLGLAAASATRPAGTRPRAPEKASPARAGAVAPDPEPADVPVKQVVLFSSGVGYFEHFGSVAGNGTTELRFKTDQINDVLKSLVLQDLDGGEVAAVTYPSQEPLSRTLKSFQVDVTDNPPLEDLLNQLRGARLTVSLDGDAGPLSGTIVGVQTRTKPAGGGKADGEGGAIDVHVLNLKVGRQIRSVPVESILGMTFEDPKLDAELDRALAALAQSRDQDKKPVTVRFRGEGERRVRMGYVVETPIWKTSYRLILSEEGAKGGRDEGEKEAAGGGSLQGWAIVENQTDSDWNNVQLALVSGRPISFIQELYRPLYIPRPVVRPELFASLQPQTYEGGMTAAERREAEAKRRAANFGDAPDFSLKSSSDADGRPRGGGGGGGQGLFRDAESEEEQDEGRLELQVGGEESIDPIASVRSAASAGRLGELFQYTVRNVSLPRQRSAMIPIVTDAIDVERLSIYNQGVLERHPLTGARVKNTTEKHLLQGPVTVLETGGYAGDARIDDVPPGQSRLLSYGIDLQVLVDVEQTADDATLVTGRISSGVLVLTRRQVSRYVYTAQNKSKSDKVLVIEHPRAERFTLTKPAPAEETTDELFRFERSLPAGRGVSVPVEGSVLESQQIALLGADVVGLGIFAEAGELPAPVRTALQEVIKRKAAVADLERQMTQRKAQVADLTAEQGRIRENMKAVGRGDEYYNRLVKKLTEQETTIETLQAESAAAGRKLEQQRNDLQAYINKLDEGEPEAAD